MKNVKLFSTEEEYNLSENLTYPHVCLTQDTDKVWIKKEESNIITFYIDGNEHIALKGMTWNEWCDMNYYHYPDGGYEGYNDGSDKFVYNGTTYNVGCDHYWNTYMDNQVSSSFNKEGGWCVGEGYVYVNDVVGNDVIIANKNYSVRLEFNLPIQP